jgi:hypothetical protein
MQISLTIAAALLLSASIAAIAIRPPDHSRKVRAG